MVSRNRHVAVLTLVLFCFSAELSAKSTTKLKITKEQKIEHKQQLERERAEKVASAHDRVIEGQKLEHSGELIDAQTSYQAAEGIIHTKEGSRDLKELNAKIKKTFSDKFAGAHRDYNAKNYKNAVAELRYAQKLDPGNKLLCYDLAVVLRDQGSRSSAVDELDRCLDSLPEGKERDQWERFRTTLITPEDSSHISPQLAHQFASINQSLQTTDAGYYHASQPSVGREACSLLAKLEAGPALPTVLFDKGRCRETAKDQQKAIQFFEEYVRVAADALDAQQEQAHLAALKSMSALPGPAGDKVREHFAEAARYFDVGRYDLAIRELSSPDVKAYPETSKTLAFLYEDFGNVEMAQHFFEEYRDSLEPPVSEARQEVMSELLSLQFKRYKYDHLVEDARVPLAGLLHLYLTGGQEKQSVLQLSIDRVEDDLGRALKIFPKGVEAHDLLAVVQQLTNNPRLAKRSYDVLWSQGQPVVFFTTTNDRVEIWPDVLQINFDPLLIDPLVELGRRKTFVAEPERTQTIKREEVQFVETKEGAVVVHTKQGEAAITPAHLAMKVSKKGPLARKYANQYTKLFQRYLGVDQTKLGKESVTHKEMGLMAIEVAVIVASIYNMTNGFKTQDMSNLITFARQAPWVVAYANDIRIILEQRQSVFQSVPLKVLPESPSQFVFRDSL